MVKQFLYIAHAVSILAFGSVYGFNYKLSLKLTLISQAAYSLLITFFVSLGIISLILIKLYTSPGKKREMIATFRVARERKGMIINSKVAFSLIGVMVGSVLADEVRKFLTIPLGSSLDWLLLLSGGLLGGFYGYYALVSLKKSFEGWEKIIVEAG